MKTGAHLKIEGMGTAVLGVRLLGDPAKPEPEHFRVCLPFGDVDITRTSDNSYWVHVRVNREDGRECITGDELPGRFVDARLDVSSKHASECDEGDFAHPDLEHVAIRIDRKRD